MGLLIGLACLLAALVGAYLLGGMHARREQEIGRLEAINEAVAEALQLERRAAALGQRLAEDEHARAAARETHTKTVTKEIVRYVERENARAAAGGAVLWLDADWVRGHDLAAVIPGDADAEPVSDGDAGPVTAGEALATVAGNYAQCYRWRDQVIGWQAWYRAGE
ncbi:hypothetical protein [Crenobacter cavernae]|uniref:Uncharacterized protein n=1 Tax=Crenobacter cavernae TaxID=2290923 RepID=A0ABY0FAP8_9NEIS|nr:hypothetical protein [Crenobacter cavernae]RXZ42724.1 hypothetical protein EBB06_12595 [Crenobacter cavernae]